MPHAVDSGERRSASPARRHGSSRIGAVATSVLCAASCLIAAQAAALAAAAGSTASPPANVSVSPPDGRDYQQPSLALDPANAHRLALAYQDGGRHDECGLALSRDGGTTWSARALVGRGGVFSVPEGFAACWNPSVAYGGGGTLYYLFQTSLLPSNPYSHVLLMVSHDGGSSFDPPAAVDPTSPAYPGHRAGGDWWPQLTVDPHRGTVYVTWSRFTPAPDSSWILMAASHDTGKSFAAPLQLSGAFEHDVTGSRVVVAPDGTVFVDWLDYTPWERGTADCNPGDPACHDWGLSPYELTTEQQEQGLLRFYQDEGPRLDFTQGMGCEDFVSPSMFLPHVNAYQPLSRGGDCTVPGSVRAAVSTDGGLTAHELDPVGTPVSLGCWVANHGQEPPPTPPQHACTATHPSTYDHNLVTAAPGHAGTEVLAAWWDSEGPEALGLSRISVSFSSDGGQHWQTRAPVGTAGLEGGIQHRPALSVAPNGRLDVVYYGLARDGTQDVYAVSATTPQLAYSAPERVSDRSSDASVGPLADDGRANFGDQLAVVSTDHAVLAAWTDARGSLQEIYFTRMPVTAPSGRHTSAGVFVAVIVVASIGTLAIIGTAAARLLVVRRRRHGRPGTEPARTPR